MQVLATQLNPNSPAYKANLAANRALLAQLEKHLAESRQQGAEKYIARARAKGKLLARERIHLVLDPGSPFLELMPLAGLGRKPIALGGTLIGGIGLVQGVLTMICANVGTVKGGTIDEVTLQKGLRLNEIARENRLPVVYLVESGGANLPDQAKIFNYGGVTFREITRRSKLGLTTIAVVHGNATAGGAYVPGMADYSIFVRGEAKVFLAGPPLVKMATHEIADEEELGGAQMHTSVSGVGDFLAQNDRDGIRLARQLMEVVALTYRPELPPFPARPPRFAAEELLGLVPEDAKTPFDAREVLARVLDDSRFTEFKPDFGNTLVTGWGRIHGYPVGILANNGVLFSDSANKGAHFIQLCNQHRVPLVFLQNITGFMVGTQYEREGIIKHGAKLINAVSNSGVPLLTVLMGASYGAGNYAMAGRAYEPRLLFSWPNSRIAVMGGEQLAGVMEIVQREAAEKSGQPYDEQQGELVKAMIRQQVEKESNAWYATGQLWDDGIIDPRQTRDHLGFGLALIHQAGFQPDSRFGVFRM